jgi:hypothetical protein
VTPDEQQAADFRRRVEARKRWRRGLAAELPRNAAAARALRDAWAPYRDAQIERHLPADDPYEDL